MESEISGLSPISSGLAGPIRNKVELMNEMELVNQWLNAYGHGQMNVAELLCDRHANQPELLALFYEDARAKEARVTFRELKYLSESFAGVLKALGVEKGDRVATLLPKSLELMVTTVALWRLGAVHLPLFTAFGPEAITYRLSGSEAKVIVTDSVNRDKLEQSAPNPPAVVCVDGGRSGDRDFWTSLEQASPLEKPVMVDPDDAFILLYTSGTTGQPKGVEVPVKALASCEAYMHFGIGLRQEDMYWNVADPGWAYGLYYGLVGTLLMGKAVLYYNAPFDPEEIYRILAKYKVTNLTAAPTAYRSMRASSKQARLPLRVASSAGEPLNPELVTWSKEAFGTAIHDQYGQTELGMVVINRLDSPDEHPVKPGSMGKAMPGFRIVLLDDEGNEVPPGTDGKLAVDTHNSPLYWFRGYRNEPEWTAERFVNNQRYYLTGDSAVMDEDGYFFYSSRTDDVITSSGYRIGPFEVESVLMEHPSVAEAAVVGVPDPLRGEAVKAYVVLRQEFQPSDQLADELRQRVKSRLAAHAYPREISFVDTLPKTPSGKIQRFLLRA